MACSASSRAAASVLLAAGKRQLGLPQPVHLLHLQPGAPTRDRRRTVTTRDGRHGDEEQEAHLDDGDDREHESRQAHERRQQRGLAAPVRLRFASSRRSTSAPLPGARVAPTPIVPVSTTLGPWPARAISD